MPEQDHRISELLSQLQDPFTPTERTILPYLVEGWTNQEIADTMVLTLGTVKFHVGQVMAKLHVKSRAQAVYVILRMGLVVLDPQDASAELARFRARQENG